MRKIFYVFCLVSLVVFVLVGCRTVSKSVSDYEACKADADCYAQMVKNGNISKAVVHNVAEQTPLGTSAADVFGSVAFNIASALTGVLLGRRLKRG